MLRRSRRHFHEHVDNDIEVMPLMNLFVALIPMLLISAVFLQMSVLRMDLPGDGDAAAPEGLGLSVEIREDAWLVSARGGSPRRVERAGEAADDELRELLAGAIAETPGEKSVVIASQQDTRYDEIVHVMDVARAAGLPNVSLTRGGRGARDR